MVSDGTTNDRPVDVAQISASCRLRSLTSDRRTWRRRTGGATYTRTGKAYRRGAIQPYGHGRCGGRGPRIGGPLLLPDDLSRHPDFHRPSPFRRPREAVPSTPPPEPR